ncbi:MAG: hypothetical protein HY895_23650 [Deltaproteobacteria bacterium]|nr:hypothetical protein [Deltaproteobacteria bacterium]
MAVALRVSKNRAWGREPALCGLGKCAPVAEQAAFSNTLHALAGGRMLVFQYPAEPHLLKKTAAVKLPAVPLAPGPARAPDNQR